MAITQTELETHAPSQQLDPHPRLRGKAQVRVFYLILISFVYGDLKFRRNAPILSASCPPIAELQVLRAIRTSSFSGYNSLTVIPIFVLRYRFRPNMLSGFLGCIQIPTRHTYSEP